MNGTAVSKNYCRGQRDNKRELCGATGNGIGQISHALKVKTEQFAKPTSLLTIKNTNLTYYYSAFGINMCHLLTFAIVTHGTESLQC